MELHAKNRPVEVARPRSPGPLRSSSSTLAKGLAVRSLKGLRFSGASVSLHKATAERK